MARPLCLTRYPGVSTATLHKTSSEVTHSKDGIVPGVAEEMMLAEEKAIPRFLVGGLGDNFGFRKPELMGLKLSQVDLGARTIRLLPGITKSDKGRVVGMPSSVFELTSDCIRGKAPDDRVFTWQNGRPVKDFRGAWAQMAKAAELPNLLVHNLRRSAVRRMLRRGIGKHVARRISGHATDAIFDRYDITDETDLADAARKLENIEIGHKLDTQFAEAAEPLVKSRFHSAGMAELADA